MLRTASPSLSSLLPPCACAQDLLLSGNYLGDAGVAALAAPLGGLPALRRLHLQNNYSISGEGSRALAAVLTASPSLEVCVWGMRRQKRGAPRDLHLKEGFRGKGGNSTSRTLDPAP